MSTPSVDVVRDRSSLNHSAHERFLFGARFFFAARFLCAARFFAVRPELARFFDGRLEERRPARAA